MARMILAVVLTVITFTLVRSDSKASAKDAMMTTTMSDKGSSSMESVSDSDVLAVMSACNESFRIDMSYLQSLNETGSFPDETDKTPKCFIRCVFENVGIVSEDGLQFNPARAAVVFAGVRNGQTMDDLGDMTNTCASDRQETCPCDRSYKFLRCLMSMEIEKYEKSS